jgi:hypothetical protein
MLNTILKDNFESFQPGLVVFFVLISALYVVVFAFTYLFYLNSKAKFYTKMSIKPTNYVLLGFVLVLFITLAVSVTVFHAINDTVFFDNNPEVIPLSWILVFLSMFQLLLLILAKYLVNKNKKSVTEFRSENFQALLDKLIQQKPSDEYLQKFKKKHVRYCSNIDQRFAIINNILDAYKPEMYQQVLVDIVMFNEINTSKTGGKSIYLQLRMFYELCLKLQNKSK